MILKYDGFILFILYFCLSVYSLIYNSSPHLFYNSFNVSHIHLIYDSFIYLYFIFRTRADMYKNITPDYYGYRDEDDGVLVLKEEVREVKEKVFKLRYLRFLSL